MSEENSQKIPEGPIISDNTTKEELLKLIESDNLAIHEGTSQYQGYHSKVSKNAFAQKVTQTQKNQAIYNIVKDLSWEERYEFVNVNKLKGNRLFKKKEYKEASEIYLESLVGLVLGSGDKEKDNRMRFELQIPILNNIASCMINLELYGNAKAICDKTIELGPHVYKTYVKRAQAFAGLLYFDKAREDYQKALQLADNQQDKNDIMRLQRKMQSQKQEEQKKYQKIFQKKKDEQNKEKQEDEEEEKDENPGKVLTFNDDLEKFSKHGIFKYPVFIANKIASKLGCQRKNKKQKYTTQKKQLNQQSDSEEDSE